MVGFQNGTGVPGNSTRPEIAHAQAFVSTVAKQKLILRLGSRARATRGKDAMAQLRDRH